MNRAELLARYMEYGHDLEVITSGEFFEFATNNKDSISHFSPMPSTGCIEATCDGWKYCHYATTYTVGWEGDHDCDVFDFRVKQTTEEERESMMSILTRQNDYSLEGGDSEELLYSEGYNGEMYDDFDYRYSQQDHQHYTMLLAEEEDRLSDFTHMRSRINDDKLFDIREWPLEDENNAFQVIWNQRFMDDLEYNYCY